MQLDIRGHRVHVTPMLCRHIVGRRRPALSRFGPREAPWDPYGPGSNPIGTSSRSSRGCGSTTWNWWSPQRAAQHRQVQGGGNFARYRTPGDRVFV